jgi:porin
LFEAVARMKQSFSGLLALAFIVTQGAGAWAQTDTTGPSEPALAFGGDFWTRPKLTGDWGGSRDQLAAHGLTFDLDVTYTFQGIPSGGIPNTGESTGNTVLSTLEVGLDTTKANLLPGGLLNMRLEERSGVSALPRAGTVSPIDNDAVSPNSPGNLNKDVFGLTELTYTQFFSPKAAVFGGLLNTSQGDNNPIAGNMRGNASFLNASFLMSLVETATVPNVALGGGGVFIPTPDILGTLTILNSQESARINPFENSRGTTFATEWTVKYKLFDQPGGQVMGFLYGIGLSRAAIDADPRVFVANLVVNGSIPTTIKNSWAFYYNAHQFIQGNEQRGCGPFLRFGVSDGNPNPIKWNLAAGIGGKGPFTGREDDRWGAGFYYLDVSDTALLNLANLGNEVGGEAFYNFGITPAMHLTFDAQSVSSARPRQQTAVILGARIALNF